MSERALFEKISVVKAAVQHLKSRWPWALVLGALGVVYGPTLATHMSWGFDPNIFNDDARQQIYPFFRYADSSLFPDDYIADYYLDCLPIGFRALYTLSAPIIDPAVSSKIIAYLALLITIAGLGVAANRLGGKAAAWAAMSLALGASLYLDRMGGGLPRAFGFPILAWALAALSYGRTKWLAVLVWLGACFYPVAGVVVGLTTAFLLLLLPGPNRGDARGWHRRRRLGFLGLVAGVSVLLLLPTVITSSKYAPVITANDTAEYPEAGPGGRYGPESRVPYTSFLHSASAAFERGVLGTGRPLAKSLVEWVSGDATQSFRSTRYRAILILFTVFTVVGWLLFIASSSASRRVAMLGVAAFVGYWMARAVAPYLYLPTRYAEYPMPLLFVLMASTAVTGFFVWRAKRLRPEVDTAAESPVHTAATLVYCLLVLLVVGGHGSTRAGLTVEVRSRAFYDAVAELPVDAVIAGWPLTAIENVPYVARRTALLTFETHQAFHRRYADVMRDRMRAIIEATYATSTAPLIRLRDEHQVTHLLVYLPGLRGEPLRYFRPFDQWAEEARLASDGKRLVLQALVERHAVYNDGTFALVDLRDLSDPT